MGKSHSKRNLKNQQILKVFCQAFPRDKTSQKWCYWQLIKITRKNRTNISNLSSIYVGIVQCLKQLWNSISISNGKKIVIVFLASFYSFILIFSEVRKPVVTFFISKTPQKFYKKFLVLIILHFFQLKIATMHNDSRDVAIDDNSLGKDSFISQKFRLAFLFSTNFWNRWKAWNHSFPSYIRQ